MKRVSMYKLDYWLIHGFNGLVNMATQRAELPVDIQRKIVDRYLSEATRFSDLCHTLVSKACEFPVDTEAELELVDSWMWRGLNGMVNMIGSRVEQIAEPMKLETVRALQSEIDKLRALVGRLNATNQGHGAAA